MGKAFFLILPALIFFIVPAPTDAQSCARPPGYSETTYNVSGKTITYYVPHASQGCDASIEGCIKTSCVGLHGQNTPVCLDAVRLGKAKYVTLASAASNYGKYYDLGTITYRSALDGQMHTVKNVVGYVHDTGCAFNGTCSATMRARYGFSSVPRPDKIDVCTTVCPTCSDAEAGAFAVGKNVTRIPSGRGEVDLTTVYPPNARASSQDPLGYGTYQPQQAMQVSTGQGATPSGGTSNSSGGGGGIVTNPGTNYEVPGMNSSPTPGPGVATLVVQSQSVRRGNSILVAWSTLGMKTDSVCKLSLKLPAQAETEIVKGNGGSRPVTIPISAQVGTGEIVLNCTPITGSPIEKRAQFAIQ